MSRISKTLAREIALKMTEAKLKTVKEYERQTQQLAYNIALRSLPESLVSAFNDYPKYFRTLSYRQFKGSGFNFETIYFPDKLDLPYNDSYTVTVKDGGELLKLYDTWQSLQAQLNSLRKDLTAAIESIGTTARLKKEFPEAAVHLPEPMTTALAFNLPDLLKRL